jgi:alkaline phosphatase D
MPSLALIADTHLAPHTPHFLENWCIFQDWLAQNPADLVVNGGDLSLDGADQDTHLLYVKNLHEDLGCPWAAIPGNHDIGEDPLNTKDAQPANAERRQRWLRCLGPDYWSRDLDGWRLIGLDAMLMSSGLPEAAEQAAWLKDTVADSGDRRLAIFVHKPFYITAPSDPYSPWAVADSARGDYAFLLAHPALRLVASGHIHSYGAERRGKVLFARVPSLSFGFEEKHQRAIPAASCVGFLAARLTADEAAVALVQPPGLAQNWTNLDAPPAWPGAADARRVALPAQPEPL